MQPIRKGMILAAGLGTRLLPITERVPKPLVPVLNVANVLHGVALLKEAGINELILNLHHLSEEIVAALGDGSRWGVRLFYSHEDQLLGTGGGLKRAEPFFRNEPFVLINCDFISDVRLAPYLERHRSRNAVATMILHDDPEKLPFYGKVGVDAASRLCLLPRKRTAEPSREGIFTGIHILQPEAFRYLEERPCGINEILYPALMEERPEDVYGDFLENAFWIDTGERATLYRATQFLLQLVARRDERMLLFLREFAGYEEKRPGVWAAPGAILPDTASFQGPVLIGDHVSIGRGAEIGPSVVLGDGARVGSDAKVSRFVGLGGPEVPSEALFRGRLQYGELSLHQDAS